MMLLLNLYSATYHQLFKHSIQNLNLFITLIHLILINFIPLNQKFNYFANDNSIEHLFSITEEFTLKSVLISSSIQFCDKINL